MAKPLAAVDTETNPVHSRPEYPPKPVGIAIKVRGKKEYLAFGHPTGNNCSQREAVARTREVLSDHTPVFHNADFDLEVLETVGVKVRGEYHDTMRSAFLNEPRSMDLGLKPQAAEHLDMPADEQNMLKNWILEHIPEAKKKKSTWADYICKAPGKLVGVYAKGDVERTLGLHHLFMRNIRDAGMEEAYLREMALIPIKLKMENRGIKVRVAKLKRELPAYRRLREDTEKAIRRRLGVGRDFNVSSSKQLANALIEKGLLHTIIRTPPSQNFPDGQVSTKRVILEQNCTDRRLVELLAVQGTLDTYIDTFLQRWLDIAESNDGYVQPTFNTVRRPSQHDGDKEYGARTGRFSSSDPNFQNIPANAEGSQSERILKILQKELAKYGVNFVGLRDYFEPDEGCVFLRRDYNQQELRILAHYDYGGGEEGLPFEEDLAGKLLKMYLENPKLDAHDAVKELVLLVTGLDFPRKHIKVTNFGLLYGMGIGKLAARLDLSPNDARRLKNAVLEAVPGIKDQMTALKGLAAEGLPFYTWGGRQYYCEEPFFKETDDGEGKQKITFEYKMLNTKIQGSAADTTKAGMINVDQNIVHSRIVLQVHDELLLSCPISKARKEMQRVREAMEDVKFRLPMLSDGELARVSWARMTDTDTLKHGENTKIWRSLQR